MQEQLRTNRQVVYDLASRHLGPLPGCFARLVYLAGLRNPSTGIYEHRDLALIYRPESVHQALSICHEEIFERALELPLVEQRREYLKFLEASGPMIPEDPAARRGLIETWMPPEAPDYLKELFQSNLQALCELLPARNSTFR